MTLEEKYRAEVHTAVEALTKCVTIATALRNDLIKRDVLSADIPEYRGMGVCGADAHLARAGRALAELCR